MSELIGLDQLQEEIDIAENYLRNSNFFDRKSSGISDVRVKSINMMSPEPSPPIDENIFFAQDLMNEPFYNQRITDNLKNPELSDDSLDELPLRRNDDFSKNSKVIEEFPSVIISDNNSRLFSEPAIFMSTEPESTKIEYIKKTQKSDFINSYHNQQIQDQRKKNSVSSKYKPRPLSATIGNRVKSDWEKTHKINNSQQWEVMSEKRYLKSREELIREAESNFEQQYTFKPVIIAKARRSPMRGMKTSSSTSNIDTNLTTKDRCHELSRTHFKREQDRKQLKDTIEKEQKKELTFKPKLSKGTETILQHKKMKEQYTLSMLTGGEQHQLSTSSFAKERDKYQTIEDVTQRLYEEAEQRMKQQQWLRKQLDETNNSKYSFHPALSPATVAICESLDYRPIYERVVDVQRAQSNKQQVLIKDYQLKRDKEFTFSPAINITYKPPHSKQNKKEIIFEDLPKDSTSTKNVTREETTIADRLLEEGKKQQEKKLLLIKEREETLQNEMIPCKISKGTELLIKRNPSINVSFMERQQLHTEKIKQKANHRINEEVKKSESWFQPSICNQSTKIIENKRNEESITDKVNRLVNESKVIEQKRLELDRKLYSKISFTPTIDPVSKALAPTTSISELMLNERGKTIRTEIIKKANDELKKQCTFHPSLPGSQQYSNKDSTQQHEPGCPLFAVNTSRSQLHVSHNYPTKSIINMKDPEKMAKDIREHLLEKERKRQEDLCVREIIELSTCTFQPTLPTRRSSSFVSVDNNNSSNLNASASRSVETVKGVDRFFELRDMSIRQKAELQQRQEDVFRAKNVDKSVRSLIDGSTIAQPFRLNEPSHRKSKAILELQKKELSELTFNPKISDSSRRLAIKKLVEAI